ncbi:beta/gamma crystallin domain-containing protein [Streptomyces sp. NPDC050560]|uniref:beta/gamma crystallin domain-containing protein n=1 Tax=Streptomyces sp. NPDC050560 TaxID=3365630 RepID=UPI0037A41D55
MFSKKWLVAAPVAAAAVLGVMVPSGSAYAINKVDCGHPGFLNIYSHTTGVKFHRCYANAGTTSLGEWVDKITTGNNRVKYYDANGSTRTYPKNYVITFPNNPPKVSKIQIL